MPDRSTIIRATLGACLIGAGLALMVSATRRLDVLHEISPEQTADEVAHASAEMAEEVTDGVVDD
jgi:hypothetical protein